MEIVDDEALKELPMINVKTYLFRFRFLSYFPANLEVSSV
jgi:hypothetical protein